MYLVGKNQSGAVQYLVLIILLLGIAVSVYLAQKTQIFKPKASNQQINWQPNSELVKSKKLKKSENILEVYLSFDSKKPRDLTIKNIKSKKGYHPALNDQPTEYRLELLDSEETIIASQNFKAPRVIMEPPPIDGKVDNKNSGGKIKDQFEFIVNLPKLDQAAKVVLFDKNSDILDTRNLNNVEQINNQENFFSVEGESISGGKKKSLIDLIFKKSKAQVPQDGFIDIVFIGDNYEPSQLPIFHSDANSYIFNLVTYSPFLENSSQFKYHYINYVGDLGCSYDLVITRLIVCDHVKVISEVNNSGVPWDEVVVIKNNSTYGGSAEFEGDIAVTYNGYWGPQVFVHELGHSFGGLLDEYLAYFGNGINDKNCFLGTPPNPLWNDLVQPSDYFLECNYPNYYRTSLASLMRNIDSYSFNKVSQKIIQEKINQFIPISTPVPTITPTITPSPSLDPTPTPTITPSASPTVAPTAVPSTTPTIIPSSTPTPSPSPTPTPTSTPEPPVKIIGVLDNANVKGRTKLKLSAQSTIPNILKVEFYINSLLKRIDAKGPYTFNYKAPKVTTMTTVEVKAVVTDKSLKKYEAKISLIVSP